MILNFKSIKGDIFGGLNASVVALPLAMAFGVESGLSATAGLVGAIVLNIIATLVGGAPLLISGPTGAMTVVSSLIIANEFEHASSLESALTTIFVIFILAGLMQIIFGLLKVGNYIRFVPYPLVSGVLSGIGIVMIITQLFPLLGHPSQIHVLGVIASFTNVIFHIQWQALSLGVLTIAIIYLFPKLTDSIPSTLVALVVVSLGAYWLSAHVPTVGDVSDEWIKWRWNHLMSFEQTQWKDVIIPAFTIAVLGSLDTLLTLVVIDMVVTGNHKSNKELIGQGLGNMLSAIAGGLPGSGATLRTVLSIRSGSKTQLASLIHSFVLLLALLEVGGIVHYIPFSVLAGILITVGISIIDYRGLRDILKIPKSDAVVMMAVMLTTIFGGLIEAFAVGIILASLSFVKKMADQNTSKAERLVLMPDQEIDLSSVEPIYLSREVFIQELSGPLFFGFVSHFREAIQALPNTRTVIFRMERVPFIDQSGLYALQDVLKQLRQKQIICLFTGLQSEPLAQLYKIGIIPRYIQEENIFNSFAFAADWVEEYLKKNPSLKLKKATFTDDLDMNNLNNRLN